ncbi:MAG TPA: hypothetical protein VIV12_26680 [Streptosporangiaceae bacterium]
MAADSSGHGHSRLAPAEPRPGDIAGVTPERTAGYSGTPLPRKLGIKPGHTISFVAAPPGFSSSLGPLPDVAVAADEGGDSPVDVIVAFVRWRLDLESQLPGLRRRMAPTCGLWIAWPKKSARVPTDMTEDVVREVALPTGLVDNKVCAIDDTWSGLRLVIRRELR